MMNIKKSLALKVYLFIFISIFVMLTGMGIYSYILQRNMVLDNIDSVINQIARRLENYMPQYIPAPDYGNIMTILELEMKSPHIYAIIYRNKVRKFTIGKVKDEDGNVGNYDFRMIRAPFKEIAVPIRHNNVELGTATLYLSDREIKRTMNALVLRILVQFFIVSITLFLVVLFVLRKLILERIFLFSRMANHFTRKKFTTRVPVYSSDELGRLAGSFNKMADIIQEYSEEMEEKVHERTIELEEANAYQSKFFENISHEFRTPLTLILGPVESVLSRTPDTSIKPDNSLFESIRYNAERLLHLINTILDFARIDARKMNLNKAAIDINPLLNLYFAMIKPACDARKLHISFDAEEKPLVVELDQDYFEKAVFNMLSNALKFTPDGGQITIKAYHTESNTLPELKRDRSYCCISISDSGQGIPADKLTEIFERFSQVKTDKRRHGEGTGIGLALSREIIELHHGKISVSSELGRGTEFKLYLPLSTKPAVKPIESERAPWTIRQDVSDIVTHLDDKQDQKTVFPQSKDSPGKDRPLILVIDDTVEMVTYIRSILDGYYRIETAYDGQTGLQKALSIKPDIILSDVMMPVMDGYDLMMNLRKIPDFDHVPVILLTARVDADLKITALKSGAYDYIVKPFQAEELLAKIHVHLSNKSRYDFQQIEKSQLIDRKTALEDVLQVQLDRAAKDHKEAELYREIVNGLSSTIVEVDRDYRLTYCNPSGLAFFEMKESMAESLMLDFIYDGDREKFKTDLMRQLTSRETVLSEYRFVTVNNAIRTGLCQSAPVIHDGKCVGVRATIINNGSIMGLAPVPGKDFFTSYDITEREKDVLLYVIKGLRNREIGEKLFISEPTVKKHVSSILQKTYSKNRQELLALLNDC